MHESIRLLRDIHPLRDPIFLGAVSGFTDTTGAAVHAIHYLAEQWDAEPVAEIDSERFFDYTVLRPHVRIEDGERIIDWPENRFYVASPPGSDRDFVLFTGVEPHLRWKTFSEAIQSVLDATGAKVSVTAGSQPSSVPHTRPAPVILSASDKEFETLFGLQAPKSRYQGQTGIVGVLNLHLRNLGQRNASLWVMAPHYISIGPNPHIALSLVRLVNRAFGTSTPLDELEEEARDFDGQVEEVLAESGEAADYVRQLEEQYDNNHTTLPPTVESGDAATSEELPPSGELISDLERFLRDQLGGSGSPGASS